VTRGPYGIVCNFGHHRATVPCRGGELMVATHAGAARAGDGEIELEPLSGALVR
jgi:hypothetical protein